MYPHLDPSFIVPSMVGILRPTDKAWGRLLEKVRQERNWKTATVAANGRHQHPGRIASVGWRGDADAVALARLVLHTLGVDEAYAEVPSVVRYGVGERYDPHWDYFDPSKPESAEWLKEGGQRTATMIVYLNGDFEGGSTRFPGRHLYFTPRAGCVLCWRNTRDDGSLIVESLHGGDPVVSGTKYIIPIWLREKKRANLFFKPCT